jgi:hypothetical protein
MKKHITKKYILNCCQFCHANIGITGIGKMAEAIADKNPLIKKTLTTKVR